MSKLIEVEIENKSYIKILDLDNPKTNILKLTTFEDNQSAVIIKVFLNNSDNRIPIKEFEVRHLKPKISGIPRFELTSSYDNKILHLELRADGRKVEDVEIKLGSYLRNKLLPLFIILSVIFAFLFFSGSRWLLNSFSFNDNTSFQTSINKPKTVNTESVLPIPSVTSKEPDKREIIPVIEEKIITTQEITKPVQEPVREMITSIHTLYFTPNNTSLQKDTTLKLKNLVKELESIPYAQVKISGYCVMTGTKEGREKLSQERAYTVLDYLKNEGWKPEKKPVIKWFGGKRPVTLNKNEIYKNRRVEIEIVLP